MFIVRAGWDLLSDGMRVLLDASIDFATLDRIQAIIKNDPQVDRIIELSGRNAGRFRFIHAEVTVKTQDLETAHQVGRHLEARIRKQIPILKKFRFYTSPGKR